jgi:histidine triad (HIT) family protein
MMKCAYCELLELKKNIIHEDEDIVVVARDNLITPGQITVFPKNHLTILEMLDDSLVKKCSVMANKVGIAVFEALGVQGTNILIQNGLGAGQKAPHFGMEIIPRKEGDNLPLQWEPTPAPEDEIETTFSLLKEEKKNLKDMAPPKEEDEKEGTGKKKDNYMIKTLRKIP